MECRLGQNSLYWLWSNLTEARISIANNKSCIQILFTCISFQCKEADLCLPGFSKENSLLECYDSDIVILQWGNSLLQCCSKKCPKWVWIILWYHDWSKYSSKNSFPGGSAVKESIGQWRRHGFDSWVRNIHWRRKRQPTPVFLSGKSHGQGILVGYIVHGVQRIGYNPMTKQHAKAVMRCIKDKRQSLERPSSGQSWKQFE